MKLCEAVDRAHRNGEANGPHSYAATARVVSRKVSNTRSRRSATPQGQGTTSALDVVDGSSTGARAPRMWLLLK